MRNATRLLIAGLGLSIGACGSSGANDGPTPTPTEARTVLEQAFDSCASSSSLPYAELGDGGDSLIIDGPSEDSSDLEESFDFSTCVLAELETPDYVISQMDSTTSLMGLREAKWEGIEASWSYHPDNGFDLVLHL